jgi:hypothetical protein
MPILLRLIAVAVVGSAWVSAATAQHVVAETEPNNSAPTATVAHIGDTIKAAISYQDIDYYAIDMPAGTKLELGLLVRTFCHGLVLWDRDGSTRLASRYCMGGAQPHDTLYYEIPTTGRYYISITHEEETPGDANHPPLAYTLKAADYTPPRPGPGNPMRRFASGLESIRGFVATPTGDIMAVEYGNSTRLVRIDPQGHPTTFASNVTPTGQIAIDAFGDLLVPDASGVSRYSLSTGARTQFTGPGGADYFYGIAIGADGDVWLAEPGGPAGGVFWRFDALGNFKQKVNLTHLRTLYLTMSQAGELFFLTQDSGDVYRLVDNTTPQLVIAAPDQSRGYGNFSIGSGNVSLDQDGWVYVTQPRQGRVLAFDAQYRLQAEPLAQVIDSLGWKQWRLAQAGTAWMRDGDGNMTSRMLVGRHLGDESTAPLEILEMNPAGMGAPGADPLLHIKRKELRTAAVSSSYADTLRLADGSSATWTMVSGSLPPGVSLASNGVLSGTPTATGSTDFAVRAANGSRAGFGRFALSVGSAVAVEIDATPLRAGALGVSYADTLRALNADAVAWSVGTGALPRGIALNSATGILTGVPTDTGSFAFTARAASGTRTGSRSFTLLITPVAVSTPDVVNALVGGTALSPALVQFLDSHGNHNGMLDVGDLRAFLRAQGQLP